MSTVRPWTDLLICWCPVVSNASDSVAGVVLAGGVAVTWHVLAETGGHACQHRAACARPRYRNYRIRLPMADLGRNQVRMPTKTTPMQETVACSSSVQTFMSKPASTRVVSMRTLGSQSGCFKAFFREAGQMMLAEIRFPG